MLVVAPRTRNSTLALQLVEETIATRGVGRAPPDRRLSQALMVYLLESVGEVLRLPNLVTGVWPRSSAVPGPPELGLSIIEQVQAPGPSIPMTRMLSL